MYAEIEKLPCKFEGIILSTNVKSTNQMIITQCQNYMILNAHRIKCVRNFIGIFFS